MRGSNVRHSAAAAGGNVASPHAPIDGIVRPIKPFDSDNTNPAGGINSSADDMAKWMMRAARRAARLADGSRLFSENTWRQLTTLVTPMPLGHRRRSWRRCGANFRGYALGLDVNDYRGHKMLTHTGGLPGYVSKVMMIPELELGIAVLTNQESGACVRVHRLPRRRSLPRRPGRPTGRRPIWRSPRARRSRVAAAERKTATDRNAASRPSLPLERYAGTYTDAWYGDIVVEPQAGKLVMRFSHTPSLVGDLEHWQYDTFIVRWRDRELRADAFVTFALNPDGSIDQAKMQAVSPSTDFSFDFHDLLLKPQRK